MTGDRSRHNKVSLRAAQEQLFQKTIQLVFEGHPYYRDLFSRIGISLEECRGLDVLSRLPITRKSDLAAQPDAFRLRPPAGAVDDDRGSVLRELVYTTGTMARAYLYDTSHDHLSRLQLLKRGCEIAGVVPGDIVLNLFPLGGVPHQGFLSAQWGPLMSGAAVVAGLTGQADPEFKVHRTLDQALAIAAEHRVTVLWGMTNYIHRVLVRACETARDLSHVRLVLTMGEPCPPGTRTDIRDRLVSLGARGVRVLNGYGATEMQGPAMECAEGSGFHVASPEEYYIEILDPWSYAPADDGAPGLVVVSHLNRRGSVLLRYALGDISALSYEPCEMCGRSNPRFSLPPYRADSLAKVNGVLVDPAALVAELAYLQPQGLRMFQVVVTGHDREGPGMGDGLLVRIVASEGSVEFLRDEIRSRVKRMTDLTPQVALVSDAAFKEESERLKFRRFVDLRSSSAD